MITALTFLAILLTAVVVHEFAHYLNARSVGVPVRAFSVGFGPVLWRRTWRGTEWRLSALPLGGYVDLPGLAAERDEDGGLKAPEGGMADLGFAGKAWVLIGGVVANFVLGTVLLTAAVVANPSFRTLTSDVPPDVSGAEIVAVAPDSLAERLDVRAGDVLARVGTAVDPTPAEAVDAIRAAGDRLRLELRRDGALVPLEVPWPPDDVPAGEPPRLGVQLAPLDVAPVPLPVAFAESATFAVRAVPEMVVGFARGFASAATGRTSEEVAGPVGIVGLVNDATQVGIAPVLVLAALINFSLAVFNLLPIPGLDGGRLLVAGVVALRGRPFRPGQEEAFHLVGIVAVLALIVLITLQEVQGLLSAG